MTFSRFVFQSLRNDFAMQCAIALGILIAAAVLTGAMLIGDSMRGSLRDLTLDRLGPIEGVISTDIFVREKFAEELEAQLGRKTASVILIPAATQYQEQTSGITLIGCSDEFWTFFEKTTPPSQWERDEILINQALWERLEAGGRRPEGGWDVVDGVWGMGNFMPSIGTVVPPPPHPTPHIPHPISLWVSKPELVPADSALGRREETLFRKRLTVRQIIPNRGIGRFSLLADQKPQPLAIVPLKWLQDRAQLNVLDKVNTIVVVGDRGWGIGDGGGGTAVPMNNSKSSPHPTPHTPSPIPILSDLGIIVRETPDGVQHIQSARLLFNDAQSDAIQKVLPDAKPVFVYLLESIKFNPPSPIPHPPSPILTPYSLVAAIDELRLNDSRFVIPENEIVLNDWTADDLGVKAGDFVTITYFDPESVYGQTASKSTTLKIAKIVPMQGTANDPELVPEIDGVSDAESLANWNPPFPFDAKWIREKDEKYWDDHKTTPKAFVALKTGQKLWGSRFGKVTTFVWGRHEAGGMRHETGASAPLVGTESVEDVNNLAKMVESPTKSLMPHASSLQPLSSLRSNPAFGLSIIPVREQGLKASAGTTPFNVLFLSFSFFIIASALMLLVLLFKLSMERKTDQLGTLLALGFSRERIFALYAAEGAVVAFFGTLFGVLAGIAYAQFLIYGLHHWWIDAIVVPFLTLHVSVSTLAIGFFGTFFISLAVILWSLHGLLKLTPLQLMRGQRAATCGRGMEIRKNASTSLTKIKILLPFFILIILFYFGNTTPDPMVRAGMFFGAGTVVLVFLLWCVRGRLEAIPNLQTGDHRSRLVALAFSNAARNPGRSMLCVGLLASTSFLVLAVGAFHLSGSDAKQRLGFSLIAETQLPVYFDLNSPEGREKLSMQPEDAKFLDEHKIRIYSARVRSGENAGCLNLYQPKTPRVLGIGDGVWGVVGRVWDGVDGEDFESFIGAEAPPSLHPTSHTPHPIPIVLDSNTAMYSLHLYKGVGEIYSLDDGRGSTIPCRVAGLLSNSFLQGDILMSEENLLKLFPEVSGFRYFLIDNCDDPAVQREVRRILTETIGDFGLSIETVQDRLNRFFAIQNTYLSTFRSLGSIGLFLGTVGMGVVQLRNVLQRRKELALLRAIGFRRIRVLELVVLESVILLLLGLAVGAVAAIVALFAQSSSVQSPFSGLLTVCLGMFIVGFLSNFFACFAVLRSPIAQTLAKESPW